MVVVLGYPFCFPGLTRKNADCLEMWYSKVRCRNNVCPGVVSHERVSGVFAVECGTVE